MKSSFVVLSTLLTVLLAGVDPVMSAPVPAPSPAPGPWVFSAVKLGSKAFRKKKPPVVVAKKRSWKKKALFGTALVTVLAGPGLLAVHDHEHRPDQALNQGNDPATGARAPAPVAPRASSHGGGGGHGSVGGK